MNTTAAPLRSRATITARPPTISMFGSRSRIRPAGRILTTTAPMTPIILPASAVLMDMAIPLMDMAWDSDSALLSD